MQMPTGSDMFTANSALNMLMQQQHHQHGQLLEQVSRGVLKQQPPLNPQTANRKLSALILHHGPLLENVCVCVCVVCARACM